MRKIQPEQRHQEKAPYDKDGLKAAPSVSGGVNATASGLPRTLNGPLCFYLTPVTGEASRIVREGGRRNAADFLCLSLFLKRGKGS